MRSAIPSDAVACRHCATIWPASITRALLPWHAAGTLSRRDADRVEQALADDCELAQRYDLVRQELVETIHLNETLGIPSARALEKLFAAIDVEEAGAPRRRRRHISRPLSLGTAST